MRRVSMLLLVLAVAFVGSLPGEAQQGKNITWTAGQVGGGWYSQAGGFVELIKSKDPKFNIKVVPGAGIQNMSIIIREATAAGACTRTTGTRSAINAVSGCASSPNGMTRGGRCGRSSLMPATERLTWPGVACVIRPSGLRTCVPRRAGTPNKITLNRTRSLWTLSRLR